MSAIATDQEIAVLEIAYQEYEAVEASISRDVPQMLGQIAYQEYEAVEKTPLPTVVEDILRVTVNVIRFAFLGKTFLFDGSKLTEFGNPAIVIYPVVATSDNRRIILAGGLKEDGTINNTVLEYGAENYQITADRNYLALVIAGTEPVHVVDTKGTVKQTVKTVASVPLLAGWRLVSKASFYAIMLPI